MPGQGSSGFIVPAIIEVSVKGLDAVKAQVQSFTEGLTKQGASAARPVDPATGEVASARRIAEDVGASVAKLRQSAREAREKTTLPGLSQAEVQQWRQVADGFEKEAQRIIRTTRELRRQEGGKVIPPLRPTPGAPVQESLQWQQTATRRPTGPGVPLAQVQGAFAEEGSEKDALATLVEGYRKRAKIAQRIVNNEEVILESGAKINDVIREQLRSEQWIAKQRLKYAQEVVSTPAGVDKTASQAEAIVAERVQKAHEGLAEQTELRTTVGQRLLDTESKLAAQRAETKAKEGTLAASNERLIAANAAITQSRLEQAARERLVQGGVPAKEAVGLQGPELIARSNAMKRIADQEQRVQDVGAYRSAGGVDIAAKTKVIDSQLQREISIAETKLNLEQGNVQSIAEEKVLRAKLTRDVAAEVRSQEDSLAIARETVTTQRDRAEQAARVSLLRAGEDPSALQGEALVARGGVVKKAQADRERIAAMQSMTKVEIDAAAQRKIAEGNLRVAMQRRERELVREQIKSGEVSGGSTFQRIQSLIRPNAAKLPEEYQTGPQFVAEKFTRTAGFAVSGGLLAGATTGIAAMVQEASKLEAALIGIRGQLDGMGQGDQLSDLRNQIKGISVETGVAADEVAVFVAAMIAMDQGNTTQALADSAAAMKLVAITGDDAATTLTQLVPIQKAFGATAEEVGNQVVAAGERYGTSAADAEKFFSKMSAAGQVAASSMTDIRALGGGLRQVFGVSLEATGDIINKQFDLVEKNLERVMRVLQANPATSGAATLIAQAVGVGDKAKALIELQRTVTQLNEGQRAALVQGLGTAQDAQLMAGLFQAAGTTLSDLRSEQDGTADSADKLNNTFQKLKDTFGVAFQSLKNAFANIGDSLMRSGLGDALKDIATLLGVIVGAVSTVVSVFATLNENTGGFVGKLLEMVVVFGVLSKAMHVLAGARQGENKSAEEGVIATNADAASKEADTAATGELAAAEGALTTERTAGVGTAGAGRGFIGQLTGQVRGVRPAFGPGAGQYATQYGATEAEIAGLGPKFRGASTMQRAFAGGTFLKSGEADAAVGATEGAATGLMASPILTGAVVIAGILAVKSSYDQMKTQTDAAADDLKKKAIRASDENIQMLKGHQDDLIDAVENTLFNIPTQAQIGTDVDAWRKAGDAYRKLGLQAAPAPDKKTLDAQEAKDKLNSVQGEVNKTIADNLDEAAKKRLEETVFRLPDMAQTFTDTGIMTPLGYESPTLKMDPEAEKKAWEDWVTKIRTPTPEGEIPLAGLSEARIALAGVSGKLPSDLQGALDDLGKQGEIDKIFGAAGDNISGALGQLGKWQELTFAPIADLEQKVKRGEITGAQYLSEGKKSLDALRRMASEAKNGEQQRQVAQYAADHQRVLDDFYSSTIQTDNAIADALSATVTTKPKQAAAKREETYMSSLKTYEQRVTELPKAIAADVAASQEQWSQIANPDERLKAMNAGVKLDPAAEMVRVERQINLDEGASAGISALARSTGESVDQITQGIARIVVKRGVSVQQAAREYAEEATARKSAAEGNVGALANKASEAAGRAMEGAFGAVSIPDITTPTADEAAVNTINVEASKRSAALAVKLSTVKHSEIKTAAVNAQEAAAAYQDTLEKRKVGGATDEDVTKAFARMNDANDATAEAFFNYTQLVGNRAVLLAGRDPVAQNAAQMDNAVKALAHARATGNERGEEQAGQLIIQLQQAAEENTRNIVRGAMAISQAQVSEDPLALARKQLEAAEYELSQAGGDADREQKQAAVIQAQKNVQNAISAGLTADAELAITLANLSNDPVTAATKAAEEAKRKLDEAVAKGIKDTSVLDPLTGQLATANKAAFLAPINKQIEDLDFLYNMEQLSLGEYVAGLEAQLSQLDVNSKEYKDLALKVFQLKKQGQQDFQFNLPTNLGLPTLYEARRATQSTTAGIGYQDNRNVNLLVQVNGAQDPMTVTNQVVSALQSAMGGGATLTPQVGVGA